MGGATAIRIKGQVFAVGRPNRRPAGSLPSGEIATFFRAGVGEPNFATQCLSESAGRRVVHIALAAGGDAATVIFDGIRYPLTVRGEREKRTTRQSEDAHGAFDAERRGRRRLGILRAADPKWDETDCRQGRQGKCRTAFSLHIETLRTQRLPPWRAGSDGGDESFLVLPPLL